MQGKIRGRNHLGLMDLSGNHSGHCSCSCLSAYGFVDKNNNNHAYINARTPVCPFVSVVTKTCSIYNAQRVTPSERDGLRVRERVLVKKKSRLT